MDKISEVFGTLIGVILIIGFVALITAFPIMWLWNWLMPTIFGLVTINFWQALGLSLLSGFLFSRTSSTNNK